MKVNKPGALKARKELDECLVQGVEYRFQHDVLAHGDVSSWRSYLAEQNELLVKVQSAIEEFEAEHGPLAEVRDPIEAAIENSARAFADHHFGLILAEKRKECK